MHLPVVTLLPPSGKVKRSELSGARVEREGRKDAGFCRKHPKLILFRKKTIP